METFVWNERYMTGEQLVDTEHQELVRLINWVIEHQDTPAQDGQMESVLNELVAYAVKHFAHEESLMVSSQCDMRFVKSHVQIHREFAGQVVAMRELDASQQDVGSLLKFLSSWLAHHILGTDQSMARQIKKIRSGVTPQQAYEDELNLPKDPTTSSLLDAMNALFRIVGNRNRSLESLNANLESQVVARTAALSETNAQLLVEQQRIELAMQQLAVTQKKLLESEHQRAEANKRNMTQLMAQIIDGDPVPTFVLDANHCITHWNRACEYITGYKSSDMVGTKDQWKAFYPENRPVMADLIVNTSLDDGYEEYYKGIFQRSKIIENAYEAEAFFPNMGATGRWLFFTAAPLLDLSGKRIGAIETLQDVSTRHQAEDDLRQYQSQLERLVLERTSQLEAANQTLEDDRTELKILLSKVEEAQQQLLQSEKMSAIGQLAAGVAHEINNPVGFVSSNLGSLKTYVNSLLGVVAAYEAVNAGGDRAMLEAVLKQADLEFLREDLPSLLDESQEGLSRVTKIVQNLKDFSRVDEAELQFADLNKCLESTLNVVWHELKYKAEIVREFGDIPEVECIPAQINQVFMNLLVNAAQAMDEMGKITLRSGVEPGFVWFEVADNGKGIPEDVLKRIFEPFFTTKPVGKGTGLGLSISYDIMVKKHGGRIEVTSKVGDGTCFKLWFPVKSEK